ncbi:MAG: fatty acyl-AMP ligase [Desulfobacterales bacterium]|nr:fatty acyl-AMP ligase [Desulfobacterales bacterium]
MEATPTEHQLPLRYGDFSSLAEALDYAARGETGANFYNGRGQLEAVLPYATLRDEAIEIARRLMGLNLPRGSRVALVAETCPDFLRFFYGCQYAGMVPVPLPASIHLGGHKSYVAQLRRLLLTCRAEVAIAPTMFLSFLTEATEGLPLAFVGTPERFSEISKAQGPVMPSGPDELAYLQYTSGSTRFPRGVMITQRTVMNNLANIIRNGVKVRTGDRSMSWLPYYHDMGLVGLVLSPMASQVTVDYLKTRDFGMRPRLWLTLISQNHATVSFGPPFGYELCVQRLREDTAGQFDLSSWRIAGVGAETIRPEPLARFASMLAPSGFNPNAFTACYGMAECALAVSFSSLDQGVQLDLVDAEQMAESQEAIPATLTAQSGPAQSKSLVKCGFALPGYDVEVRDDGGRPLPERHVGTLFVRGPSVMSGYFGEEALTREVLSPEGWLNTGDLAYVVDGSIVITGRQKDLIIINGRNIWPQDMEYIAESQPEVRTGDASAFSVSAPDGEDKAVLVIECRDSNEAKRDELVSRLQALIRQDLGIDCFIELVPRNTLPRTTSGKLSRSGAKKDFLQRVADGKTEQPGAIYETYALRRRAS